MIDPSRCTNFQCLPPPSLQYRSWLPTTGHTPWGLSMQGRGEEYNWLPLLVRLQNGIAWALEQGGGRSCGHSFNPAQQAPCVSLAHSFHPQCSLMRENGCWHSCHIVTFKGVGVKKQVFLDESGPCIFLEPHTPLLFLCSPHPGTWVTESNKTKS